MLWYRTTSEILKATYILENTISKDKHQKKRGIADYENFMLFGGSIKARDIS